jgi:DNA invertase Pin-like site-specific DNA recombinase
METALIIARCSTDETRQNVNRQTQELEAKYGNHYDIVKTFAYYQSGTKNEDINLEMLSFAIENGVQNIIVSEISRISRKVLSVLEFIEKCNTEKINVVIENYNLHTLNKDKTINTMVQMMLSIGASFSQAELIQTKIRLNSGRDKYIRDGGKLGRKVGSKKDTKRLTTEHADIVKFIKQGQSVRNTMKLTNKSSGTVQKIKKILELV